MATILKSFGSGHGNLAPGGSQGAPDLATALRDIADDLAMLRTAQIAAATKLNADGGVTDTNYDVALTALKTIKG